MFVSNPLLLSREAYVPGLSKEYVSKTYGIPIGEIAKLGSAENPLGPSLKACQAIQAAMPRLEVYPEWTSRVLRERIAEEYGFDSGQVICGAGETEIISWIIRVFSAPGDRVQMYAPAFPMYHIAAENEGRAPRFVGMGDELEFRLEDFLEQLAERPRIVFLTNPHSPTSRLLPEEHIRRVCEAAGDALVVLDEAYIHFTQTEGALHLVREYPNLIALRTFSKAFGLGGLRVGFGVATREVIAPLLQLKPTWNLGQLQLAGASAALDDKAHVSRTVAEVAANRAYVVDKLTSMNRFRVIGDPRANFLLLRIEDPSLDSKRAFLELLKQGVIVKDCSLSFVGLGDRHLRIDIGLRKDMDRLIRALSAIDTTAGPRS